MNEKKKEEEDFNIDFGFGSLKLCGLFDNHRENIKKAPGAPEAEEKREPLSDIFDKGDAIVVMLEMPGVVKEDINVDIEGDMLEVVAQCQSRKYRKELLLPAQVEAETVAWIYENGVLEVTLKKS